MKKTVSEFLEKHNMYFKQISIEKEQSKFLTEIRSGLSGAPSSLYMFPTYLSPDVTVPTDKPVIVVDAGGTNFRTALVTLKKNAAPLVEHFKTMPMPGSVTSISKEDFFSEIVDCLEPLLKYSSIIGFCFSFPVKILPNLDGEILFLSKQVMVDGIKGSHIGESINKELTKRGHKEKKIVVLNDTVAVFLSKLAQANPSYSNNIMACVLGTGINSSYSQAATGITKIENPTSFGKHMLINNEAGAYNHFPKGTFDYELDKNTVDTGIFGFEKMVSGRYLGRLLHLIIKGAAEENLFSDEFKKAYSYKSEIPLWEVNDFCDDPNGDNPLSNMLKTENDSAILLEIFDAMYHRTARFLAIHFAAILEQISPLSSPEEPFIIIGNGTTLERSSFLKLHLQNYIDTYLREQGHYCRLELAKDSALAGSAVAGLIG